ncbi:MAG TPA: hypothetical protein VFY89_00245 [Ktedonobacterales bacterium]
MTWHGAEMGMAMGLEMGMANGAEWRSGGLGTAVVARGGRWVIPPTQPVAPAPPSPAERHQVVRVPRDVLRMMAEAAWAAGCSEEEIWIEAAREWLRRRLRDDDPPPTAPASAWPSHPRATRAWAAIDALVAELRPSA